jgi:hypothetical protein
METSLSRSGECVETKNKFTSVTACLAACVVENILN